MRRIYLYSQVIVMFLVIIFVVGWSYVNGLNPFRIIPIRACENGYSNFKSTVIVSENDLEDFLKKTCMRFGWNNRKDFEETLYNAEVDFHKEALVLLRHSDCSGSITVRIETPVLKSKTLYCRISRNVPLIATCDLVSYCLAIAVDKDAVHKVEFNNNQNKKVQLTISEEKTVEQTGAPDK
ncbi:MAG: hypothetical protein P9X24_08065 [Candidatus Hatepunaea meridiana]|nr:hypothetical protein [Candidatus Hatepunaea meridiana]